MSDLFIPILIASLIVLNTMMGSVYERFREIGVYSAVGLAPVHVAFLFIAEACVYAVLGTVSGYMLGQAVAKLLLWQGWLSGVTVNYSAQSAVVSSALVMAVVILSTLYPARQASLMAVPDVSRRWKIPEPEGDDWRFEFPFTVGGNDVFGLCVFLTDYFDSHSGEAMGAFYTDGAHLYGKGGVGGSGYAIRTTLWLAPFASGRERGASLRGGTHRPIRYLYPHAHPQATLRRSRFVAARQPGFHEYPPQAVSHLADRRPRRKSGVQGKRHADTRIGRTGGETGLRDCTAPAGCSVFRKLQSGNRLCKILH